MYGLVNRAIQEMVCDYYDSETWETIKHRAQVTDVQFLAMEAYPDDLTHRLVKAASEVLGLTSAEIMQAFGQYWVTFTGKAGYAEIMDMAGETLPEFLSNLDELHARVGIQFPQLQPPSFDCEEIEEDVLELHYRSEREGLSEMVVGLVKGLGDRFQTPVEVDHLQRKQTGQHQQAGESHDIFRVRHRSGE